MALLPNIKSSKPKPLVIKQDSQQFYLIAIGASAGGLDALQEFLLHYPPTLTNTAIIIAQHLSPTHKSMLVQLLSRETKWKVAEAENNKEIKAGVVYITPPNADISVVKNKIVISPPHAVIGPKPSVDILFSSIATAFKKNAVAVILSGTGTDGSKGIMAIANEGGFTLVQKPDTAKFDGMPNAAIATQKIHSICEPGKMGEIIALYIKNPENKNSLFEMDSIDSPDWNNIFKLMAKNKGTDFSHYKTGTINRRLIKRLNALKIETPGQYFEILKDSPEEQNELFSIFLISVTNFFRDKEAFKSLEKKLRKLILEKKKNDTIRIWVVACATGEEVYSIAILLTEILKDRLKDYNIQIFATDVEEKAVQFARRGIYTSRITEEISPALVKKYFVETEEGYELVKEIRSMVLFSRHDVTSNPPFLKLDLISCRNLLIYFDQELQKRLFPIFHYALNAHGILFLGKSETIGSFTDLYETVDAKNRVFVRALNSKAGAIKFSSYITALKPSAASSARVVRSPQSIKELVKETLFNTYEHAYVVVNGQYEVMEINGDVRLYLSLSQGTMNNSILKMANQDLQLTIRTLISRCIKEQQQIKSSVQKFELFKQQHFVRLLVRPTIGTLEGTTYYIVIFEKVEKEEVVHVNRRNRPADNNAQIMLQLEQELAATRQHLQTYIEEMESANEELQSLNEELQSTNEEMQSTNEQLETTNEELQSTSEEVQITYNELRTSHLLLELKEDKIRLSEANLQALLNNTLQLFFLVDNSYKIVAFNKKAEEYVKEKLGKTARVGQSVIDLIAPENLDHFLRDFKKALGGEIVEGESRELDIHGNLYWYKNNFTPIITANGIVTGVSVSSMDITETRKLEAELHNKEKILSSVFNVTSIGIAVTDEQGCFIDVNQEFCNMYGFDRQELLGKNQTDLIAASQRKKVQKLHTDFIHGKIKEGGVELIAVKKNREEFDIFSSSELMIQEDGRRFKVNSVRDISTEKKANRVIEASQVKYRAIVDNSMNAFFLTRPDGTIIEVNNAATKLFGYTEAEFIQMGRQGFIVQDEKLVVKLKQREEKGFAIGQANCIKKNGERIICEFSSVVFTDIDGDRRTSTMMTDITDRKKAEKLLDDTNRLARVGGWEVDLVNSTVFWSPVTKEIHEVPPDYTPELGTALHFFKAGESTDLIKEVFTNAIQNGEPYDVELQLVTAKGNERWVRAAGRPEFEAGKIVRVFGSFMDIHEQKLAALELERSRQEYQSLFVNNPNAVISFGLDGTILQANHTAATIAETDLEELLHQNFINFLSPEEIERVMAIFEKVKAGSSEAYITKIISRKNNSKYLGVSSMPIVVDDEITGVYSIIKDITKEKANEDELLFQAHVLNAIKQAVIVTEVDGTIISWNKYAEDLYGWKKEEVMGKNIIDITPSDLSMEEAIGIMKKLGRGESWSGEFMVKHKQGNYFKALVHDSPLLDTAGNLTGIIGVSWDVTKEYEARDYIKFQANLLDSVEQAVIASDLDGIIFYWNHFAEKVYGWTKDEAIGKNVSMLRTEHTFYNELGDQLMNQFREGKSWAGEFMVQNKLGVEFPIFSVNSPIYNNQHELNGIIAVSYDISERIKAQQQKEFERLDKEALINSSKDLIWSVSREFTMIAANNAFLDAVAAYVGRPLQAGDYLLSKEFYPKEYLDFWKKQYQRGFNGESFTVEIHVPELNGVPENYSEASFTPIKNEDEIIGIACYGRNVTESRLFQQRLLQINHKLETAQHIAKLGYWERDVKTNTFFWSEQIRQMLGLPHDTTSSSLESFVEMIHPDDRQKVLKATAIKSDQITSSLEYRVVLKNSVVKHLEAIGSLIKDEKGLPLRIEGTLQDITERKLIEEAILESEERFRVMFSKAPLGMALIDSLNGDIIDANERYAEIAGRTLEELKKIDWLQITHPDDVQEDLDNMTLLNAKKIPGFTMQKRYVHPNGTFIWIQMSIAPIDATDPLHPRHLCMVEDITQRRTAELALHHSNERYDLVARATNDAIWDWDIESDKVIRTGRGLESLFEYSSEEASANNEFWTKNVHPKDIERVVTNRLKILANPQELFWEDEYRFLKANGSYAFVYDKGYIIRNKAGKAIRLIGATQDITQRKETELLLKELNEKLEKRASELEISNTELERFAYVSSHDLQEPLRMISSFLQLLEKRYKGQLDETADQYIHYAVDGANRMKTLILDLLEYSRVGTSSDEVGATDMNAVVEEVLGIFKPQVIELEATIKVNPLPVLPNTRRTQLLQLFQNLVGNALKYHSKKKPEIVIDVKEEPTEWLFSVKDNGIGFDKKFADKVFIIFQRLHNHNEYSGTGIGLSICKKIIEKHGGKIWVDAAPGTGSIFYFTIPKTTS